MKFVAKRANNCVWENGDHLCLFLLKEHQGHVYFVSLYIFFSEKKDHLLHIYIIFERVLIFKCDYVNVHSFYEKCFA